MTIHNLYDADPGESISYMAEEALKHARMFGQVCFIRFNDTVVPVSSIDTQESIVYRYNLMREESAIVEAKNKGQVLTVEELSKKIANFIMNM